jgi:hypothetical protein
LEATLQLMGLRRSKLARILGPSSELEVEAVLDLVSHLSQGIGPRPKDVVAYDAFFLLIIKRVEHFFVKMVPTPGCIFKSSTRLVGLQAIQAQYDEVALAMSAEDTSPTVTMSSLQSLKTWSYLLSLPQQLELKLWISKCIARISSPGVVSGAIADKAEGKSSGSGGASIVPMPLDSCCAAAPPSSSTTTSTATTKKKIAEKSASSSMLKFFVAKAK